jgi:cytochrome P450
MKPDVLDGRFDAEIMSEAFKRDPFALYNSIRETAPVYWCEPWSAFLLTRYDHVVMALRDSDRFSSEGRHAAFSDGLEADDRDKVVHATQTMLDTDPPEHTRLRKLSTKAFAPRSVEKLRPLVEEDTRELLSGVDGTAPFDFIATVARPLPAMAIARMMGLPLEDSETFLDWVDGVIDYWSTTPPTPQTAARIDRVVTETNQYFSDFLTRVADRPPDTIVGELMRAHDEGDRLSYSELVTYCGMLLNAASDTTRSLIGNTVVALLEHPEILARLRKDPALIPPAVEEGLRYSSPLLRAPRITRCDIELQGRTIPKGHMVFAIMAAANRDPRVFDHPDEFDIDRDSNPKNIAFGSGRHFCIGAPIARLQAEIVIETMLGMFGDIVLDGVEWRPLHLIRSPERVILSAH